jgi:hypothetical protein
LSNSSPKKRFIFTFIKNNKIPLGILGVSIVAFAYFSSGFVANLVYFADPRHQNQPLEGWMTPRYVGMSYDLPPNILDDVMELRPKVDKRKPLTKVVEDMGITLSELNKRIIAAQEAHLESLEKKKPKKRERQPAPKDD